ncbi:hypothetical protein [Hyphomonas sp.]|uniref:hypothetical protein n=1 Tax=Hyphomonas sp. TaxID=87 RepID=UPI00391B8480
MKPFGPLILLGSIALIGSACQTAPPPMPEVAEEVADEYETIEVPEPPDPDTPMLNEWGGEVPLSVPTGTVTAEGLEDLS